MGRLVLEDFFVELADEVEKALVIIYTRQMLLRPIGNLRVNHSALEHLLSHDLVAEFHVGDSAEYENPWILWNFSIRSISKSRFCELFHISVFSFIHQFLTNLHKLSQILLNIRFCPFFAFLGRSLTETLLVIVDIGLFLWNLAFLRGRGQGRIVAVELQFLLSIWFAQHVWHDAGDGC